MNISQRAQSSSNLLSSQCNGGTTLSPPFANQATLRTRSTINLSNSISSSRNRALSWSPVRLDAPVKVSHMPWVRQDKNNSESSSRRNSSIDGSVAKAKMVWEKASCKSTTMQEDRGLLLKKGASSSFKHPKPTVEPPSIQKSSTSENLLITSPQDEIAKETNLNLRPIGNKTSPQDEIANLRPKEGKSHKNGTNDRQALSKRHGYIGSDSDGSSGVSCNESQGGPTPSTPPSTTAIGVGDVSVADVSLRINPLKLTLILYYRRNSIVSSGR